VKDNVEAAKLGGKPVDKSNSEETAETAKEGEATDVLSKDVETAVVVESPKDSKEDATKEETKESSTNNDAPFPDIGGANGADDEDEFIRNMFSMDEDTFQYYQQAEQEAETKATEAQSKAIASFCNIIFQIIFAGLFVGKLNQVYDERGEPEEGTSSFSTFWIIFPLLLFAGCTICCCFCAIFCAAEVDTHMHSEDKEGEEQEAEAQEPTKEDEVIIEQTPTSEGMELDIEGQAPIKVDTAPVEVEALPQKKEKESEMDDLD
jgi:hypothetical protein